MTAIEALAAGTPVVGTRVGALPDVVDEGETGVLAPPGDSEALGDAISEALALVERSDTDIERTARSRADDYSWQSVAREFSAVYEEVTE
jgi:glycosyltransferase involved in cell wall biosynthesis